MISLGCFWGVSGVSSGCKCVQEQQFRRMMMKITAKDLVAARVGSWPYIKRRLSNDKGFGNEALAMYYVDPDNF